jgi:hypothetical protein
MLTIIDPGKGELNMKWKARDKEAEKEKIREAIKKWHNWFAWHPVNIDGYYHWLKTVERKWAPLTLSNLRLGTGNTWSYRESTLRVGQRSF